MKTLNGDNTRDTVIGWDQTRDGIRSKRRGTLVAIDVPLALGEVFVLDQGDGATVCKVVRVVRTKTIVQTTVEFIEK